MRPATNSDFPGVPEWQVSQWFNTDTALRVADLRGRAVLVHAVQMLCPGCVSQVLPQAAQVHQNRAAPASPSSACIRCSSITRP